MPATVMKDGDQLVTLPSGDRILYRDQTHKYWSVIDLTTEVVDGGKVQTEPLVGVTSITGCLDKSRALMPWVEEQTCTAILRLLEADQILPGSPQGLRSLMRNLEVGYNFVRDQAATRGQSVHDALERLATGQGLPKLGDFPESDRGFVRALASFWLDAQPVTLATEEIVASRRLGVAGRYDLLASIDTRALVVDAGSGERGEIPAGTYRWDLKTGKGIYPVEHFAQLAGYERLARDSGHDWSDGQIVIRLDESGAYEVAVSAATEDDFIGVLGAYRASRRLSASRPRKRKQVAA